MQFWSCMQLTFWLTARSDMISKLKSIIFPVSAPQVLASKLYAGCFRILHPDAAGGNADFEITVGKSKVPNAGYGLHVTKGVVKKGDIVALYSGYYFPPPPKWSVASPDGEQPLTPFHIDVALSKFITEETTAYQIHCDSQGGYIDGIEYTLQTTHRNPHGVAALRKPRTSAQLINHPPMGTKPNVFSPDFAWTEYLTYVQENKFISVAEVDKEMEIIEQVNSIGEGTWYYDPWVASTVMLSNRCAPCAGLAAVAVRDIHEGEELYLDYKYHKKDQPAWYTPVQHE